MSEATQDTDVIDNAGVVLCPFCRKEIEPGHSTQTIEASDRILLCHVKCSDPYRGQYRRLPAWPDQKNPAARPQNVIPMPYPYPKTADWPENWPIEKLCMYVAKQVADELKMTDPEEKRLFRIRLASVILVFVREWKNDRKTE